MKRWLPEESSKLFLDAVSSINIHSQKLYKTDLVLANYPAAEGTMDTLDKLWNAMIESEKEAAKLSGHPKKYLEGIIDGIKMIVRVMQGDEIPYADQILAMQQIVSKKISDEQIGALSELLDKDLTELGYKTGTCAEKTMTFLADSCLPAEGVVPMTNEFLSRCRESSHKKVFPLPAESAISDIQGVRNVIYSGNSAYLGNFKGKLSFNIDRPWSKPTFCNILCHEGYPGHHAFYGRWDELFMADELPAEAAYYIKNTPTNALFEGVPENALHFLDWDVMEADTPEITDHEKKIFAAGRKILDLQRMYQQNGCHFVNIEGMDKAGAVEYMLSSGLFQPSEAESAYRFFTDATRRTYYPSYFYGRWMVYNAYRRIDKEKRAEFFKFTYDVPHTNDTYIEKIKEFTGGDWAPYETEGSLSK